MNNKAFTLIELVMVIVVIAIVAVFVSQQLGNVFATKAGGLKSKLQADVRYAQKLAMTRNQRVRVTFAANSYGITIAGNPIADPATGRNYPIALGAGDYVGVTIAAIGFAGNYVEFDALGVPYDGGGALPAATSVTVAGGGANSNVTVQPQTGAVN